MASTFAVTRNHLIFGLCLPFALLLGYLLADVRDPVSLVIIGIAFAVLSIPLLMRWYHLVLIFCWNMAAQPALPGHPYLWSLMAPIGLLFAVLNRAVNAEGRLAPVPALNLPLLFFLGVVVVTAALTGGIGLKVLRSDTVGGKGYFFIVAAIAGYFALASRSIHPSRAGLYLALFFLPGLLAISSRLATWIGPAADFVHLLFPPEFETTLVDVSQVSLGESRLIGVASAAMMVFCWLLARFGLSGVFEWSKPWRAVTFIGVIFAGMLGGFRSTAIMMALTLFVLFILGKLWRTRAVWLLVVFTLLGAVTVAGFATKLPYTVQRTLSFLPIEIDPAAKLDAQNSSEWRLDMWKVAWGQVPTYLFQGKGYVTTVDDLYMANYSAAMGLGRNWEWALLSGDYHNGSLSLLIPFGLWGLLGFLWLVIVGNLYLYRAYRASSLELRRINALLFAIFLARTVFFFTVFGGISYDLYFFTGILGLSVALNVANRPAAAPETEALPPD